ncbi:ABC transporter permease [Amycolatopsis sp. cmx-4-54]|uniref:ABC transporter permease n=1 Tax=Amycolatopsis sp. cmx-4-54 TaxID=2790936 RepID=UPI003979AED0
MSTVALPGTFSLGLVRGAAEIKQFFRIREQVIFTFAFPSLLMILLGSMLNSSMPGVAITTGQVLAAGMIGSGIVSTSFTSIGINLASDRELGALKRLRGTPMPAASYFVGKIILVGFTSIAQVVLMSIVGSLLFDLDLPTDPAKLLTALWVFLLGITSCTLLGIALGSVTRTVSGAVAVTNLIYIALQFVSGVFVTPITALPKVMVDIASFFPVKWICQGFRSVFLPAEAATQEMAGTWELPMVALVLTTWCAAGLLLAKLTFRWSNEGR